MHINWGKGIVIGMSLFMLFIISMAGYMIQSPADEFDVHYYEKGLDYDAEYAKKQRVMDDNARPALTVANGTVSIAFINNVSGSVLFSRPSDKKMDRVYQVQNQDAVAINSLPQGKWQLTLTWQHNNRQYLYKQGIYIP